MYLFTGAPAGGDGDYIADSEGRVGVVDEDVARVVEML
jgi:hypothetical protein